MQQQQVMKHQSCGVVGPRQKWLCLWLEIDSVSEMAVTLWSTILLEESEAELASEAAVTIVDDPGWGIGGGNGLRDAGRCQLYFFMVGV